jgi:hypothetical protein
MNVPLYINVIYHIVVHRCAIPFWDMFSQFWAKQRI